MKSCKWCAQTLFLKKREAVSSFKKRQYCDKRCSTAHMKTKMGTMFRNHDHSDAYKPGRG